MKDPYKGKLTTPEAALERLKSGQRVLVGSGAAEPQVLVAALAERGKFLDDTEVMHLMTLGPAPYAGPEFAGHLRHNALFIGSNVRHAVAQGLADYTPCFLHEVPALIRSGRLPVDAALVQVSPPRDGKVSLGIAVDILQAAITSSSLVVAQVNAFMPWTQGDSLVSVDDIDAFVLGDAPLLELHQPDLSPDALAIGRYVALLIEHGATLQLGIGGIPNAVLRALEGKRDLGIHSEMISDGILPLIKKGVITGRQKTIHPEVAFTVDDPFQGQGIGCFLMDYLTWIAKGRGLKGFCAELARFNKPMRGLLEHSFKKAVETDLGPDGVRISVSFKDWKGRGNPAHQEEPCLPKKSCAVKSSP